MDRFPQMLYRFPATGGDAVALQDGAYSTLLVDGDEALGAALAEGWHESAAEARQADADRIAAALATAPGANASPDDNAPPTRAELEAKANELGITFRSNTSDKALTDRIAAALEP